MEKQNGFQYDPERIVVLHGIPLFTGLAVRRIEADRVFDRPMRVHRETVRRGGDPNVTGRPSRTGSEYRAQHRLFLRGNPFHVGIAGIAEACRGDLRIRSGDPVQGQGMARKIQRENLWRGKQEHGDVVHGILGIPSKVLTVPMPSLP